MIDWSKYPAFGKLVDRMNHAEDMEFRRLLVDLRRADRERYVEVCRRRAYQHGNPMGTAPQCVTDEAFACAAAIEAMGNNDG